MTARVVSCPGADFRTGHASACVWACVQSAASAAVDDGAVAPDDRRGDTGEVPDLTRLRVCCAALEQDNEKGFAAAIRLLRDCVNRCTEQFKTAGAAAFSDVWFNDAVGVAIPRLTGSAWGARYPSMLLNHVHDTFCRVVSLAVRLLPAIERFPGMMIALQLLLGTLAVAAAVAVAVALRTCLRAPLFVAVVGAVTARGVAPRRECRRRLRAGASGPSVRRRSRTAWPLARCPRSST